MRDPDRWRRYRRFWRPDIDADIDDELRFHLDMRARDFAGAGLGPGAARDAALSRFGDVDSIASQLREHDIERHRRQRRIEMLNELLQDVRYGARKLRNSPGFAVTTLAVVALGIGATTAIFSLVHAALLRPLPYAQPHRLVALEDVQAESEVTPVSFAEFRDWSGATNIFGRVAAFYESGANLTGAGEPEMLSGMRMSAALPALLGVAPGVGRSFRADEEGPTAERVVMIGEALWRRRFAADPRLVASTVTLDGNPHVVIGIIPATASAVLPSDLATGRHRDFWAPLRLSDDRAPRGLHFLHVVGQLRAGADVAQAEGRLASFAERVRETGVTDHGIRMSDLHTRIVGESRPMLLLLMGAVLTVLLIGCANVANLLLARGAARERELAIRAVLGAPRTRIVRQLVTEALLLSVVGGSLGVLIANLAIGAVRAARLQNLPRLDEASLDGTVLLFALLLSIVTGLVFGLAPALSAARDRLGETLKSGGRGSTGTIARERLRGGLVVAEVALSFVLLVAAGLLARSFDRLLSVDKGFDAEGLLTAELTIPTSRYGDAGRQVEFFRAVVERTRALPGVRHAAIVNNLPIEGGVNGGFGIEGRAFPDGESPIAEKRIASEDYFGVLGTPVVAGREFTAADAAGAPQVAVVNETFVRRYFPDRNPIGQRLDFAWETTGMQTIVGVVADIREQALNQPAVPAIYVAFAQRPSTSMYLVIRAGGDPAALAPAVRRAVMAVDPIQPLASVRTLNEVVARGVAGRRASMSLFGIFSAAALLLAAIGLYGVISYSVAQRRQEIGIRMALGAERVGVLRLVLGRGLLLIATGIALGVVGSLAIGRVLSGMLFGVGAADPSTFLAVSLLLVAVAVLASALPAVRASRVDPMVALRQE